jgi:hypothetical protein
MKTVSVLGGLLICGLILGCESRERDASMHVPTSTYKSISKGKASATSSPSNLSSSSKRGIDALKSQKELETAVSIFESAESNFGVSNDLYSLQVNARYIDQMTDSIRIVSEVESQVSAFGGTGVRDLRMNLENRRDRYLKRYKMDASIIKQKADFKSAMEWLD